MSERPLPNATTPQNGSAGPAVLSLDGAGRVTAANASARTLWQAGDTELIGEPFAALFVFEVTAQDPEILVAQWEVLVSAAAAGPVALQAQPREGAPLPVQVHLEAATGSSAGYLAVVTAAPAPAATAATTPGPDTGTALLAEHGAAGFFDLNFRENRIHYSPAWKRLLGYVDAELPNTYETWLQALHPDDTAAAPDKLRKKRSPGPAPFSVEFRMKHRRGHFVWIQCLGVQVVGADGTLERVAGLHLDITERKELEEASLANDDRLQALTDDDAPLAAFELDFTNQVFWYSPAWRRALGFGDGDKTEGEAAFAAVLPPAAAEAGVAAFFLAPATGQTNFIESVELRHRDGRLVPCLLGVHRQLNRRRELTRIVGFVCPLAPAPAAAGGGLAGPLLDELLDTLAEGAIATDERGKVLAVNAAAGRLLGLSAGQLTGQLIGDIFRLVNRQSGRPGEDAVDRVLSADGPLPLIAEDALLPAGPAAAGQPEPAPLPIVWTARVGRDATGKPLGVVVVFRDPEEMRLTPEELVRSNRFESLGLLAGGIAHDFNNLLTTILGAVSLAKDSHDTSKLPDAEKACLTAKGLTKQLLAFAKGSGGTQSVVHPREILEDAVKIAAAASTAVVTVETSDELGPVQVDRGQILQVFQNLVINALQAMPPAPHAAQVQLRAGNATLAEGQVPPLPAGAYVQFEVRDNGSGIKPEHLEKIWDPFFTTKKHGTGLGLATVLSIVRQHGGMIGVDSTLGVGTVFTVFFPVADRPVEVQARKPATLRFGTGRVLLMDDDASITELTATMLQSLDYKYDTAKNGEEAIVLYKRYLNIGRPYDAVIMDLTVIGGMGGEECFHELKKLDPDVRAIVSSGYDNDEMARRFLDLGFCGYLTKPYRVTDLGKLLKAVLG